MSVFFKFSRREKALLRRTLFITYDVSFPVSDGHCLIISNKMKETYFDLSKDERFELLVMIDEAKKIIEKNRSPDGYNIGMNCGVHAGQSVMHYHCHVIPRYKGDNKPAWWG